MPQLIKNETFADGELVTALRLNNIIDLATLGTQSITAQTAVTTFDIQSTDYLLVYDSSATALRKASIDDIFRSGQSIKASSIAGVSGSHLIVAIAGGFAFVINGNTNITGDLVGTGLIQGATAKFGTELTIPSGTTATRPASPLAGSTRFNTDVGAIEVYSGSSWSSQFPVGSVMLFANSSAPSGWAKCNGTAVSRTSGTYSALFAVIGTTYGAGDGVTTFNLPDLRGEFVRGWDDGRGVDTGRAIGSTQQQQLEYHKHIASNNDCQSYSSVNGVGTGTYNTWCDTNGVVTNNAAALTGDGSHTEQTAKMGQETRPRNVAMMYCIKL